MKNTAAGVPFILICVLLDILGIGLIIPVLPQLVGDLAGSQSAQAWWLGAMLVAYGLMQFCFAPTLGALSDRYGRRPVLLLGIFGGNYVPRAGAFTVAARHFIFKNLGRHVRRKHRRCSSLHFRRD